METGAANPGSRHSMPAQRADRLSNGVKERILGTTEKAVGGGSNSGQAVISRSDFMFHISLPFP